MCFEFSSLYHTAGFVKKKGGSAVKKRFLALFVALALCLSVLTASLSAYATETPHFLAVNENLLQLEDRYIPIIADGLYYVPYPALDVASTGIDLGVYPVYNAAIRTLTIYNREKVIAFDLTAGTCTDRDGTSYNCRAVTRNGQVYVPAKFICDFFDLTYSYFPETKFGPMIRICSATAKLNDRHFLAAAQMQMEDRLRDWRKNQTPAPSPTPTQTSTTRPTQTADPTPTPTKPVVNKSNVRTYLAFRVDQTDGLISLLNRLEYYQISAIFFFPAGDLSQYDEAVRRVLCAGHGVGLAVSGTTAEEMSANAAEGNRVLRQIAYSTTYTVLIPDGVDADTKAALGDSGLLVWEPDVDAVPDGQAVSARAERIMEQVERYKAEVNILSDCSSAASTLMAWVMPSLVEDQYDLRLAVETEIQKEG